MPAQILDAARKQRGQAAGIALYAERLPGRRIELPGIIQPHAGRRVGIARRPNIKLSLRAIAADHLAQLHIGEQHVANIARPDGMQVDRPFRYTACLRELQLLDLPRPHRRIARTHRHKQRIGLAPVARRRIVADKGQMAEEQPPHRAAVARQNADAAVGVKQGAVSDGNVLDIVEGFGADLKGAAVRAQLAIADSDLTRGAA